jgi:hypothetical protein
MSNTHRCIRTEFSGVYVQAPRTPQNTYIIENSPGERKSYMSWNTIRSDDYSDDACRQRHIELNASSTISLQGVVIDPQKLQGSVRAKVTGSSWNMSVEVSPTNAKERMRQIRVSDAKLEEDIRNGRDGRVLHQGKYLYTSVIRLRY